MCEAISKIWLFIFNSIFFIGGVVLVTFGGLILAAFNSHQYSNLHQNVDIDRAYSVGITLIVIGVVVMFVTFLGCFGAILENKLMLLTFAVILTLIVGAQIGLGIYVGVQEKFSDRMAEVFIHSKWDQHAHMDHIDAVQNMFKCCGYFGPDEYLNSTNTEDHHDMLPSSCCGSNGYNYCLIEFAYEKGCKEKFLDALEENFGIIIGVAVGFAVFEIIGIVFSCVLFKKTHRIY